MEEDSVEYRIRQYIVTRAAEGAMAAGQELSRSVGVGLEDVLAAVQRALDPDAVFVGAGSLTVTAAVATGRGSAPAPTVTLREYGAGADSLAIASAEVDEVTRQVSRGGLARLNANQRILAAVVLIAAIYPLLPLEVQEWLNKESGIAAAIAAVLALIKG